MTATQHDSEIIAALDWAPPCQCNYHAEHGEGPASWAVWARSCCPNRPGFGLMCDACLQYTLTTARRGRCRSCGHTVPVLRDVLLRFERVRPPS